MVEDTIEAIGLSLKRRNMNDFSQIISKLERERLKIDNALKALRDVSALGATGHVNERGGVTPEGRQRQIEAMRRYWAERKARDASKSAKTKRGGLTEAGRRKLSEAMRKRWAAKRVASRKSTGTKNKAA